MKPAYAQLYQANKAWHTVHAKDSTLLAGNGRLINWYKGAYAEEQALRQDSNNKLQVSQGKAKRRGWTIALESLALALLGYATVTH
jgi:hypothetical protein